MTLTSVQTADLTCFGWVQTLRRDQSSGWPQRGDKAVEFGAFDARADALEELGMS